jgi:hypothetical protein
MRKRFSLTTASSSPLNSLPLRKFFLGEQLEISTLRLFPNGELSGLAGRVHVVQAASLPHSGIVPVRLSSWVHLRFVSCQDSFRRHVIKIRPPHEVGKLLR